MAAPDERSFITFERGSVRDNVLLESFRNSLRSLNNPATGVPFTEDEIQRATQPGSRFYIEAEAIDLLGMAYQERAVYYSDQLDPRRSNTAVLDNNHSNMWLGENSRLPAVGASGLVNAPGSAGSLYVGSTTLGDPAAAIATDPNGVRFQVLVSETIAPGDTEVSLQMQAVISEDADGNATNIAVGTILTWSANQPLGSDPEATVLDQTGTGVGMSGGFDRESDQELAVRVAERIASRPASGNPAHFQAWARQVSVATEQAFVYPCAFNAGSVLVAAAQKRNITGSPQGPLAREATIGLLTALRSFLVAPGSPAVPQRVHVVVTGMTVELADQITRITMGQGTAAGWFDVEPWPNPVQPANPALTEQVRITTLSSQTQFTVTTTSLLPGQTAAVPLTLTGADAPSIMAWNRDISRFEQLSVQSIQHDGVNLATIVLATAPGFTLVDNTDIDGGTRVSPYTDRLTLIAESIEAYFDDLGPGEVVASTDPRFFRAARHPRPQVDYPLRAGQSLIAFLIDNLGGVSSDAELSYLEQSTPTLPTSVTDGPNIIGVGHLNIYPLS